MILEEELYNMYWLQEMSTTEIAKKIYATPRTVLDWMKKYGIETRTISEARLIGSSRPSEKKLRDMYLDQKMSQLEIAKVFDVTSKTVFNWMKRYGIKTRTISESMLVKSLRPPKEKLYNMYQVQKMSISKIAKEINVSTATIFDWMIGYGIETRKHSDFIGENGCNWQGGISGGKYCYKFNKSFKESVRGRDNYTCQLCGIEQNGRKLDIHHIHYDKENCYPDVVALCRSCNMHVNGDRNYWEEYFENQLIERGLYCWSLS